MGDQGSSAAEKKHFCSICGEPATGFVRETIEIDPDFKTGFRQYIPGPVTFYCTNCLNPPAKKPKPPAPPAWNADGRGVTISQIVQLLTDLDYSQLIVILNAIRQMKKDNE